MDTRSASLDCTASVQSSRSSEMPHSVPCRPEAATQLGVSSTPQPTTQEKTCQGHRPTLPKIKIKVGNGLARCQIQGIARTNGVDIGCLTNLGDMLEPA